MKFSAIRYEIYNIYIYTILNSPELIPSERESAVPPPSNNANDNKSNYSSDNSELDLDGKCPAESVNTGFASLGISKDDHRI